MDCPSGRSENLIRTTIQVSQFRNPKVEAQTTLQRVTGNITLDVPLTNKGVLYMKARSGSKDKWTDNMYTLKLTGGVCKAYMDHMPDLMRKIFKLEPEEHRNPSCVIPKGVYIAEDTPVNWSLPKLPIFPYGTWRTEVGIDIGTDVKPRNIMCFVVDVMTIPKLQ
ncbi:uncharacterized protein LOC117646926 isoform X2 [Thrips palmi]|nr:uncharacterized protein LOC117646926 isoform X2 [Thrips palmi]